MLPVLALPVAFGLTAVTRRLWFYLALAPLALGTLWLTAVGWVEYEGQSADIAGQVEIAQWLAAHLSDDARIGVEAAGAARFYTPRTMRIVDLEGLNDRELAHARFDPALRLQVIRQRKLTHMVLPAAWAASLARVFPLQPRAEFVDAERWDGVRHFKSRTIVFGVSGAP
jgi:hypothetical protein